jgi:uncharacterized SAM-binding protein YcdF (DUF218 family)
MRRVFYLLLCLLLIGSLAFVFAPVTLYENVPDHNTTQKHFDTLIVLGTPAMLSGRVTPEMRERVGEGVREYKAGVASHIIMSGGAAHTPWVEGKVMAALAVSEGVPQDAIMVEGRSHDTLQNLWYSRQIMQEQGWHSAEVISTPYHLTRTELILTHYTGPLGFSWRTHAAPWSPEYGPFKRFGFRLVESLSLLKFRLRSIWKSPFLPEPSKSTGAENY